MSSQRVMGVPNNVLTIDILACAKLYKGKSIYKYNYDVGDISKSENLLKGRSICQEVTTFHSGQQPTPWGQRSHEAFTGWYRDGANELCKVGELFQGLDVLVRIAFSSSIHTRFRVRSLSCLFFHSMPQPMNFALFQVHASGFPTFLLLLKFFAPSGMSFCLLLCQISKYYCAKYFFSMKSSLSVQLETVRTHSLFLLGGTFLFSPRRPMFSED